MQYVTLGNTEIESSRLVYGCMRIAGDGSRDDAERGKEAVRAAVRAGYTHFDHADIYGKGRCETLFGEVLKESPGLRERVFITTKCGIRFAGEPADTDPQRYDFSRTHLTAGVAGSLERLGIEQIDMLLLHRPDFLFDPDEVARTFEELKRAGSVAHFGVSNFSPSQVELLRSASDEALLVNQVEINIHNVSTISDGTLDQCMRLGITPQAWAPIAGVVHPALANTLDDEDEARIREELDRQCDIYGVEDWIVVLAWLLRHPAEIAPIIGSTRPERIEAAKLALDVRYSREDWYRLLEARNGFPVR